MAYDVKTLLQMRTSLPFVMFNVEKLNRHANVGKLFVVPLLCCTFLGHRLLTYSAAVIVRLPEQALSGSCASVSTKALGSLIIQHNRRTARSTLLSSDSTGESVKSRSTTKWLFRRRESTDRSVPQSAPTGFAAQQAENFQRFYRAVVSPSHVRVTAGGRIVPNNRVKGPPLLQWNNERLAFETTASHDPAKFDGMSLNLNFEVATVLRSYFKGYLTP